MSELAELGEIAKETPHPYYGSELEAADKRRLAERTRVHDIQQTQRKQQQNFGAQEASRQAEYARTRANNPATPPTPTAGGGARGAVSDADFEAYHAARGTTGDHRMQARNHPTGVGEDTGEKVGQKPRTTAQYTEDLENIRANRAHDVSGATAPGPHAASQVKAGAKPGGFKLPKGSKRGIAGLTALTGGAAAMHAKRARDAAG